MVAHEEIMSEVRRQVAPLPPRNGRRAGWCGRQRTVMNRILEELGP